MRAWLGRHSTLVATLLVSAFVLPGLGYLDHLSNNPEHALERQKKNAEVAKTKASCRSKRLCHEYGEARQQCAIAPNLDVCIQIKMGADSSSVFNCTEDGELRGGAPTLRECLVVRLIDALGGY